MTPLTGGPGPNPRPRSQGPWPRGQFGRPANRRRRYSAAAPVHTWACYFDESGRNEEAKSAAHDVAASNLFMLVGLVSVLVSLIPFLAGCLGIAWAFGRVYGV